MNPNVRSVWAALLCGALASCGGGPSPVPAATGGGEIDFEETGSMRALAADEQAPDVPVWRAIGEQDSAEDMARLHLRSERPPADTREMYQRLAPATVIVRSEATMGTGVLVGPGGLVLTNNHVIAHAEYDNFRMRVTVEYGNIGDAGSMVPDGQRRIAYVLERDPARDLALLRIEDPIPNRPIVGLSAQEPTPGQTVTTLGHGDIGMVWAIRRCEVEATGRLEETYARLAAVCGSEEARAVEMCRTMRERMHRDMQGMVIQTSCPLSPGDSGGPLVDPAGDLVGLNVMTIRNIQGQHSNYHIHVREVRDFLAQVPDEPLVEVPRPWIEHQQAEQQDQDLDGRFDTVVLRGRGVTATLIDLDQDSPEAPLAVRSTERGFDPEVAVVTRMPHRFVWYDSNSDGTLDLILSLDSSWRVEAAHTVHGASIAEAQVPPGPALASSRLPPALRARFDRIFHAHASDHPSPMPALLRRGELTDSDHDGSMDTVHGSRMGVHAVAFDVDQNTTARLTPDAVDAFISGGRMDAEFAMVFREPTLFAYYDRDDDGRFETGLRHAPGSSVVAAIVPMDGAPALNTSDVVGTLGLRGDWFGERADAFRAMLLPNVVNSWIATADDVSALPHPVGHHRQTQFESSYSADGWEHFVLRTRHDGYTTSLVDVDRSSWRGRNRRYRDDVNAAVTEGRFSADFAVISTRAAFWAWYDRDHDGRWDLCLVEVADGPRTLHNAFVREGDRFVHAPDLVDGPPLRPALIRRRHRARFDTFVRAYFSENLVTPAGT